MSFNAGINILKGVCVGGGIGLLGGAYFAGQSEKHSRNARRLDGEGNYGFMLEKFNALGAISASTLSVVSGPIIGGGSVAGYLGAKKIAPLLKGVPKPVKIASIVIPTTYLAAVVAYDVGNKE